MERFGAALSSIVLLAAWSCANGVDPVADSNNDMLSTHDAGDKTHEDTTNNAGSSAGGSDSGGSAGSENEAGESAGGDAGDGGGATGGDAGQAQGGDAGAGGNGGDGGSGGDTEGGDAGAGGMTYSGSETLQGYWRFDTGSGDSAVDSSGHGHDGVLTSNTGPLPGWTTGNLDGAIELTGENFVRVAHHSDFNKINAASAFTVAAWTYRTSHKSSWAMVASRQYKTSGSEHWGLAFRDGFPTILGDTSSVGANFCQSSNQTALNAWVHIAGVYDGSVLKVYADGAEACTANIAGPMVNDDTVSDIIIGGNANSADMTAQETFVGKVDELVIYSRALTANEISDLAAAMPPPAE